MSKEVEVLDVWSSVARFRDFVKFKRGYDFSTGRDNLAKYFIFQNMQYLIGYLLLFPT